MRQLSFPPELVPKLLPIVLGWMATYAEKDDPDTVDQGDLGDPMPRPGPS